MNEDKIQILTCLRLFHVNLAHHHIHTLIICARRSGDQRCSGVALVCGVTGYIIGDRAATIGKIQDTPPREWSCFGYIGPPPGAKCDDVTLECIKKLAQHFGARYLSPIMMVGQSIGGEKRVH